jgi:hypothetical protein
MLNGAGTPADYHGAAGSGVAGPTTGSRALDFSSNGANQPGSPGPLAAATNASLGFGTISNFVVSLWFKQNTTMAAGANIGPRMFVLGGGAPADTGATNSIGLKFQTSSQLYFQIGAFLTSATFPTNLPANAWLFFAAVYDGSNLMLYQGSDTNSAALVSATAAPGLAVNFGGSGARFIGNRQNLQRSFDGWIDDFRFYTGAGDANFVESIRSLALHPLASISVQFAGNQLTLSWPSGSLQSASNLSGPWYEFTGTNSPFTVIPTERQQFYRLRLQ